jgi:predicted GIY-YIG superfamily endonuclease
MNDVTKLTYLYRCFDRYGVLLYVGITDDPDRRMQDHAVEKFWWNDVATKTHMAFKTREQALWAEWAVISTCHPLHNRRTSAPGEHRCPQPAKHECPPPPLPIDGHIYMLQKYAEIKANAEAYRTADEKIQRMFAEANADRSASGPWRLDYQAPASRTTIAEYDRLPND